MTSTMYKTILDFGNDHPHFRLCLDPQQETMKIYNEATDLVRLAICDIRKSGHVELQDGERQEFFYDRFFVLPSIFGSDIDPAGIL